MKEKDLNYAISILKGEQTNIEPDWFSVLGFLSFHRIQGLFYNRAKRRGILLPKKVENILRGTFEKQKRKTIFLRKQIREISEKLRYAGAKHLLLKGSVLTNISEEDVRIYEDGERISNDIDILVKPDGITEVSKTLYELGFVQGVYNVEENKIEEFSRLEIVKRRMNRGEVAPFVKMTGNTEFPFVEVDINFSLGNTPEDGKDLLSAMIDAASIYKGKVYMSVADEELFFLHLIMHQYKESCLLFMVERGKELDIYKLADIYYLLKENVLDFERLKALVKEYGLEQKSGVVLQQVGEIFCDEDILKLSECFQYCQPKIIDYETKKTYEWQATLQTRLCTFSTKKYLKEVET